MALALIFPPVLAAAGIRVQDDPWSVVRRVYADPFGVDAFCIQRRVPSDGKGVLLVHIAVSKHRGIVSRVVEPTSMSGYVMHDDGMTLRNFDPDSELVWEQPSPNLYRPDVTQRMQWAKKNYDAKLAGTARVGSRSGVMIRLVPRHNGMPERRLTVDPSEDMLLRSERRDDDGWVRTVDTLVIQYGVGSSKNLSYPASSKVKKSWGPRPTAQFSARELRQLLGFEPKTPTALPYGFQTLARHVVGGTERPFAAFRVTDGIANATVYAWSPAIHPKGKPVDYSPTAESDSGVKFVATGDVPAEVLVDLAESFAQALQSQWEPEGPSESLPAITAPNRRTTTIPPQESNEQPD